MSISRLGKFEEPCVSELTPTEQQVPNLQERCLDVIILNFGRYSSAYKLRGNNVPKKNWEFLERRYSETIFSVLKDKNKLEADHLDLLINSHVRELDLVGIERKILPYLIERLKIHGGNIVALRSTSLGLGASFDKELISSLPNVEKIEYSHQTYDLYESRSTSKRKSLSKFFRSKIRAAKLVVSFPQIYKAIGKNCSRLQVLKLHFPYNYDVEEHNDGISFILKRCPRLESLEYPDTIGALYAMHKNDLILMRERKNSTSDDGTKYVLKTLSSTNRDYPLCHALEICSAICPYATYLSIDYLESDAELEKISHFTQLDDVKLENVDRAVSTTCLHQFLKLRGCSLIKLEMFCKSSLSASTLVECCPNLHSLKLHIDRGHTFNKSSDFSCEGSLASLQTLVLSGANFRNGETADALKFILSAAKNTKELSLTGSSGLTNEFISSLNLFGIHDLDVSASDIKVDPLKDLLLRGKLQTLNINHCRCIPAHDYFDLTKCDQSSSVDIKWTLPEHRQYIRCRIGVCR